MCFSMQASFSAAAVLGLIAFKSISIVKEKSMILLSLTPLLFAIQQLLEGMIWFTIEHPHHPNLKKFFVYCYLMFAYIIWPVWLPLVVLFMEKCINRKFLIVLFLIAGVLFSTYNSYIIIYHPMKINIINHSIQYTFSGYITFYSFIYFLIAITPFFLSTENKLNLVGIMGLLSNIITLFFYKFTFVSVWCFFSALISLYFYYILKARNYQILQQGTEFTKN